MRTYVALGFVLASFTACGKSCGTPANRGPAHDGGRSSLAASDPLSADECRRQATAIGHLLVGAAREQPNPVVVPDGVHLVARSDLPPRHAAYPPALSVMLTPDQIVLAGQSIPDLTALEAGLRRAAKREGATESILRQSATHAPRLAYFVIDSATPWQRVVAAVNAATRAGFDAPAFVFAYTRTLEPLPHSNIDSELDAIERLPGTERGPALAKLTARTIVSCPPLRKAYAAIATVPPEEKAMAIARAVAPSVIACDCKVNLPALRTLVFRALHVSRPVRVLAFDPSAPKASIMLPRRMTWAEASKRFTPTLRNATLIAGKIRRHGE